jgi:hypothetical protein
MLLVVLWKKSVPRFDRTSIFHHHSEYDAGIVHQIGDHQSTTTTTTINPITASFLPSMDGPIEDHPHHDDNIPIGVSSVMLPPPTKTGPNLLVAIVATIVLSFGTTTATTAITPLPAFAFYYNNDIPPLLENVRWSSSSSSSSTFGSDLFNHHDHFSLLASSSSPSSTDNHPAHNQNDVGRLLLDGRPKKGSTSSSSSRRVLRQFRMQDRRLEQCEESGKNWEQCFYYGATTTGIEDRSSSSGNAFRQQHGSTAVVVDDPAKMRTGTNINIMQSSKKVPTW